MILQPPAQHLPNTGIEEETWLRMHINTQLKKKKSMKLETDKEG
jgi:hypothetical protein